MPWSVQKKYLSFVEDSDCIQSRFKTSLLRTKSSTDEGRCSLNKFLENTRCSFHLAQKKIKYDANVHLTYDELIEFRNKEILEKRVKYITEIVREKIKRNKREMRLPKKPIWNWMTVISSIFYLFSNILWNVKVWNILLNKKRLLSLI